ncbi:MAG: hypothetical protein ACYT04_37940, partial [Nostoc sp.]
MTAASNQIKSTAWDKKQEYSLTAESLKMLLEQRIPLIRLKEFATEEECEMLYDQTQLLNFNAYEDVSPKIEKVGITVFEYNSISKADYFKEVERASEEGRRQKAEGRRFAISVGFRPTVIAGHQI